MHDLPTGKLPPELLERLLERYRPSDPRVLVGPGIGEDAAVIDFGDRCLVAKSDPVTFATDEIGWYAVHVNANDIACCGGTPRWFLATVLLPESGTTESLAESVFEQIADACGALGITLCGGHTEITHGLDRPIVAGQMLGEVERDSIITSDGARIGDAILLTKGYALEGAAILAREKRGQLAGTMTGKALDACAAFLHVPGISVVEDARLAIEAGGVHALHDPTEGGVATGLAELAHAAGVGLRVERERLPVLAECAAVCAALGLEPLGLIASGSLLVVADPRHANDILDHLSASGISATEIGTVTDAAEGLRLVDADGAQHPLPSFPRDEITRIFQ